ncbi:MAG: hypothetical protein GX654_13075 [Desulfatiglans sp.]|nr:hypothetical protein [Desulfatiglans sp.]
MINSKIAVCIITILFLCTNAYADNPSANEILKNVTATYKSMKTYKAKGTITSIHKYTNNIGKAELSFTILLKKPNMYILTWDQTNLRPGELYSCVLWCDGTQRYLLNRKVNFLFKFANDEMALSAAKFYHGPVHIMPTLLLPVFKGNEAPFSWLKDPKVEKIEKIGDEDCYVISGTSVTSQKETIWISNKSYLIMKYYYEPDYLKILKQATKISDEEKKLREEWIKKKKENDFHIEIYTDISSPELNKEDFNYIVPQGIELRDWPGD